MSKFRDLIKNFQGGFDRKSYTGLVQSSNISNTNWDTSDFLKANEISLYVNKSVEMRAKKVGQVKWVLKKGDKIITEDPYLDLINRPNDYFTGVKFWTLYQKHMDLCGCAFIWKVRGSGSFDSKSKITELHLLRPDLVEVKFGEDGKISEFIFTANGTAKTYKPEEIIYDFNPDPSSPLKGMSLLKSGVKAIGTELQIEDYQSTVIKHGGKVEGIFKFKTPKLTREQVEESRASYKDQMAGAKKSGLPLFLGGDVDYQNIGLSPSELSYLEAKRVTLDDICILTSVPKSLLGLTSGETFSNADASIRIFLRETVKPLLDGLKDLLNEFLIPEGYELDYIDPTPEDRELKLKEIESGIKNYYMTPNEAREIQGLDPIDGGDDLLIPFSLMPAQSPDVNQDASKDTESGTKDHRSQRESLNKKKTKHPLKDKYLRQKYGEIMIKRMDRSEEKFAKLLRQYLKEQRERLIDRISPIHTRIFRYKGLIDDNFDKTIELKLAKEKFLPLLEDLLVQAGVDSKEISGSRFDFHVSAEIKTWLEHKANIFWDINDTTFKKLQNEFAQSLELQESRNDLVKRIEQTYGNISEGRAKTIARTEVLGVTQKGTLEGYRQANMPVKIWVTVMDDRTRDSHAEMDGEEVPIDMPFSNGLNFPGDQSGDASEVCNCRCVI